MLTNEEFDTINTMLPILNCLGMDGKDRTLPRIETNEELFISIETYRVVANLATIAENARKALSDTIKNYSALHGGKAVNTATGECYGETSTYERKSFDAAAFNQEHPELYDQYVSISKVTTFRIAKAEDRVLERINAQAV